MGACGFLGMVVHQRDCDSASIVLIVTWTNCIGAMADEHAALLTIPRVTPAEADYDVICQAMMGTARGRWFLEQYAKRNRNTDTGLVLDAIARIEGMVRGEQVQAARQELRGDLLEMARTIAQTRADLAETTPPPPPPSTNGATANGAANDA